MARCVAVVLSILLVPRAAGSASYFLPDPSDTIRIVDQSAIVVFGDGWEELSLTAQLIGPRKPFVWLIPVPAVPQVLPMPARPFEALSATGNPGMTHRTVMSSGCAAPVTRLHQPTGMPHRSTETLGSAGELAAWSERRRHRLSPAVLQNLGSNVRGSGRILALHFSPLPWRPGSEFPDTVVVGPLRLRFATAEPVYPAGVNPAGDPAPETRLYLLAPSYLVPEGDDPDWSIDLRDSVSLSGNVFLENGAYVPGTVRLPGVADPDSRFAGLADPPICLTRAAAHPADPSRADVRFRPYDPIAELTRPEVERRAVAATFIGRRRFPGGFEALRAFLAGRPTPDEDVYSAIWAVGQLAEPGAGEVLEPWARMEDPETRVQAMAAFTACGAREGLEPSLSVVTSPSKGEGAFEMNIKRSAVRFLSEHGDSGAVSALWRSANGNDGRAAWQNGWKEDEDYSRFLLGLNAVTALAGMGDHEAIRIILEALRQEAPLTSDSALVAQAGAKCGHDRFSWTNFWLFSGIRAPYGVGDWRNLQTFLWETRSLPGLQRTIIDSLLSDPGIPDAGRVLLIASLPGRTEAHIDTLETVCRRALRDRASETTLQLWTVGDDYRSERINLTALAAVHCLDRFERSDRLARLLPAAAAADTFLAREIAAALAVRGDESGLSFCDSVVKDEWPRLARAPEYRRSVESYIGNPEFRIWDVLGDFDVSWRTARIILGLKSSRGTGYWRGRMADRATPDLLRLMWISVAESTGDLHESRRMLRRLRTEGISDPLVRSVIRRVEQHFAEVEPWYDILEPLVGGTVRE